ncbi:MAG: signal peptide peptidase SppA [Desulfurivibrio sp.]|nr:MAG: signal peptide peptidase SppA [Desulfurivibrio sp.]
MSQERLFRQRHPLLTGFFILGVLLMFFGFGITFFVVSMGRQAGTSHFLVTDNETVGIIQLKGLISDADKILDQLLQFRQLKSVKAVVVRIDSPGGAVGASQEIFSEIARLNKVKPVVASMGSVAASGGYYAALGAGKIVASPGTLTGSMGVIFKFPNLEKIFQKIGYKDEVIKSGELKDIGSPSRPLTAEERALLQDLLDEVHEQFIRDIAQSRNLPAEDVRKVADGRIFSGETAKKLGLIDQLGNFNDAVSLAASLAGMESDTPTLVYPEDDDLSLFKMLAEQNASSLLRGLISRNPILSFE